MERDHDLERQLLEQSSAHPGFAEQVLARLDHAEAKYGNTGWAQDLDTLLAEMQEEAADIAGWGIGAALQLEGPGRRRLVAAMRLGAAAWSELNELREQLTARG